MAGQIYNIPPQPHVVDDTRLLPAGVITFGVEYRDLDPESLRATYADNAEHLAELEEKSPEGGFADEGVSIHVFDADDGHEYLRFDVFDAEPHYHYNHRTADGGEVMNNVVDFDSVALGDMLPWVIERLHTRLAEMLTEAGGAHLIDGLDADLVDRTVDQVHELAASARKEAAQTSRKSRAT